MMHRRRPPGLAGTVLIALASLVIGVGCIPGLWPWFPSADTDGDGYSNWRELGNDPPTDPHDAADNPGNIRDTDGDGCSDYGETSLGHCDGDPHTPEPPGTVAITGTIMVGTTLVIDGDTADPANPVIENDTATSAGAQGVPNPCTVGGFLGGGSQGTDVRDVFQVQMAAGQVATLLIARPGDNDFDLFLYDEVGVRLDTSEGVGRAEQVTAPDNGRFLVEVYAYSVDREGDTGGLYSLLIGENAEAAWAAFASRDSLSSLDPFVEGEVLVRYAETARTARSRVIEEPDFEILGTGENTGGYCRLRIKPEVLTQSKAEARYRRFPTSPTIAAVKTLRRRSDVVVAEPNYLRRIAATPNDEFYSRQWHYPLIGLPEAWDFTTGSSDVIVAVIDTGVVMTHPDLAEQFVAGFDFIANAGRALDGDGLDSDPTDPGDSAGGEIPSSFHGTHVAGTIAARTNNAIGVAGIAWNVRIMPVRALGRGGAGADHDIAQAIRFAAGLNNDSGTLPERRADVINLSIGGPGFSQMLADTITDARGTGAILIAAAGNNAGNADEFYPGAMVGTVSVSAVDFSLGLAPYSNSGSTVAVTAPGGNLRADDNGDGTSDGVLSTTATDDNALTYAYYDGTSTAAPHVSGVVALMKSVNPDLGPDDVDRLLAGTHSGTSLRITDDLGRPGWDASFGHGLINALSAVRAAAEIAGTSVSPSPIVRVTPQSLSFGRDETHIDVTVTNGGAGTLSVTHVEPDRIWIDVTPTTGGEGTYAVTIDRAGLPDGIYSGKVVFTSNGGNFTVPVRMNVGPPQAGGGSVGTVYVLLVDPDTLETVEQDETSAAEGYAFRFSKVAAGRYRLYAGSDLNNDLYIDQEGEAFGGYPIRSRPQILDASDDLTNLPFSVTWQINVQTPSIASRRGDRTDTPADSIQLRRIRAHE